jgi:hypothetical protein
MLRLGFLPKEGRRVWELGMPEGDCGLVLEERF